MDSCIYEGIIIHRRRVPVENAFRFRSWFLFLDLDEIEQVFKRRWLWSVSSFNFAWFNYRDHLANFQLNSRFEIKARLLEILQQHGIDAPIRKVRLLTQLRYLGFEMNPVCFYYCYSPDERLQAIVAEVNNTPWGEQHLYLIDAGSNPAESKNLVRAKSIPKEFHVSPFMPMDMEYSMAFTMPGESLGVHIANSRGDQRVLNVVMKLERKQISGARLAWQLIRFPMITMQVFAGIYWQAFKLYLKKVPFFTHPKKKHVLPSEPVPAATEVTSFPNPISHNSSQDPSVLIDS